MKTWLLSVLVFACVAVTGASADTITFNFATTPNASLGTNTFTYTAGGVSITATGTADLYFKSEGADETGLGLTNDANHEIAAGQSITLDLTSLLSLNVTDLSLTLGSIQAGEAASVCDANLCISFNSSDDGKAVSILSLFADMKANNLTQLTINGVTGNVLLEQLTAITSVPEPSSLLLVGSGMFMMAGMARKLVARRSA